MQIGGEGGVGIYCTTLGEASQSHLRLNCCNLASFLAYSLVPDGEAMFAVARDHGQTSIVPFHKAGFS